MQALQRLYRQMPDAALYAGKVYVDGEFQFSVSASPNYDVPPEPTHPEVEPPMTNQPTYYDDGSLADPFEPPMFPVQELGLPIVGGALALSALWPVIPNEWKDEVLKALAGTAGVIVGGRITKGALLGVVRNIPRVGPIIAAALATALVAVDTITVGDDSLDIPFVPSIPLPGPLSGSLSDVPALASSAEHGPIIRSWIAGGQPFVRFQDGWQAARKKDGTWTFWKPVKPVVFVPGGPMSRRNARRLASIYDREKKRAKKDFGLVDSKARR